jgi:hypothetical protein
MKDLLLSTIANHQIASVCLIVAGIIILILVYNAFRLSKESLTWPTVEGEIVKTNLQTSETSQVQGTSYNANIEYKYRVQSVYYTSSRIYFGSKIGHSFKEDRSKDLVKKYTATQLVKIFYNPDNHKISVLEPGIHSELRSGVIIGVILMIIGLVFLILKL